MYAFEGELFQLSCLVEKHHSSQIYMKWIVHQSCRHKNEINQNLSIKISDVETTFLGEGKERIRSNITLMDLSASEQNGSILECLINDVSMANKSNRFQLIIYDEPSLDIELGLESTSQIVRCNSDWSLRIDLKSKPNDLDAIELLWFKSNDRNETRKLLSTIDQRDWNRIRIATKSSQSGAIQTEIFIKHLVPMDSGDYILQANLLNGLIIKNQTISLRVLDCTIGNGFFYKFIR
ncbi:hypothetical protein QR98_0009010 [Sarcoptes scabiei]|uniref:Uncharacterized protein n=1 Tax=Sarcoptes scabiei TaxID=52283 RepID=A0A131ZUR0_SARSC|nr:hypothetical protein QR98_0009010 [Sarcoptes scabiei]